MMSIETEKYRKSFRDQKYMGVLSTNPNPGGRGPGRPRDEDVRKRILCAAAALLGKMGFSEISIDAIAERSGAGKATIYRWWPSKAAVLIDAFRDTVTRDLPVPKTGSLREDIRRQLVQFFAIMSGERGRIFSAFIGAAQTDPDVAEAFRSMWITPRRAEAKVIFQEYCENGELAADLDLDCAIEILFAPLYYRLLTGWAPVTEPYIEMLTDTALNGLRSGPRTDAAPPFRP